VPGERLRRSSSALRVALDTRALDGDATTGVGRYIEALVTRFNSGADVRLLTYRAGGLRVIGPQLLTPLAMRRDGAQLVHGPANSLPLLHPGLPGVVTIHDLAIYDHPEWFPAGQWFATRVIVPRSIRGARMIICPSAATMRANQLRLWFASMAYVLLCALRRIALHHTPFAKATCGTIRLKLLKIGALVRVSVRRIKVAMASACPAAHAWGCAASRLVAAANARASPA